MTNVWDGTWFEETTVSSVAEGCVSLCATPTAVVDEVVGVVPLDAGNAVALTTAAWVVESDVLKASVLPRISADVDVVLETAAAVEEVVAVVLASTVTTAALVEDDAFAPPPTFGAAAILVVVEENVNTADADAASAAPSVVEALGTAVQCCPFIEVI